MDQEYYNQNDRELQSGLLDALLGNDYDTFCKLLDSGQVDPSYRYGKPHFGSCLEIASRHPELPAHFIHKLVSCGAKLNVNVVVPEPVHFAARSGNAAALHILISNPRTKVNARDNSGQTALHYIVLGFKEDVPSKLASEYESCIEILMECSRFDITIIDNEGRTALHLAANKKRLKAALAIIEKARATHRDLDVDKHVVGGRTTREALEVEIPEVCVRLAEEGTSIPANKKRLLKAMDLGDLPLFQRLLKRAAEKDGFDVDFWFDQPYSTRLLEHACTLHDKNLSIKFVKATLDAGARPSSLNLCSRRTPLHVAVATENFPALKLLVDHPLANVNAKDANGQTPLHTAASCASSGHNHDCLHLLLNTEGIDVNAKDIYGRTPADVAECTDALLMIENKGGKKGDIPHTPQMLRTIGPASSLEEGGGSAHSVGKRSTVLFDGVSDELNLRSINPYIPEVECDKRRLFNLMAQRHYAEFEELFDKMTFDEAFLKCDECGYTYLQYACERGLHDFARKLLKKVDPNQTHKRNRRTPLIIACLQNDKLMVHLLLNTKTVREINTNATDNKQNTALHYAAKNEEMDIVLELLSHGADMLAKNMFGNYPLSVKEIQYLLDKSICVKENILPSNDDYAVIFNYKMFISQRTPEEKLKYKKEILVEGCPSQIEKVKGNSVLLGPRTHLSYSEMNFLNALSTSCNYSQILKHPLISSFLRIKDDRMRPFLSLNLVLCITFVITLNTYIIAEVSNIYKDSSLMMSLKMTLCATAFMCTMFMLFREVMQMALKTSLYVKNSENLFDLALILFASLILLQCPLGSFYHWACTACILLSWRDLFIVTGRHYRFSTNVQMLKAVSLNYLQFLKSYIFIIFAFCLSFFVIFSQTANESMSMSNNSQATDMPDGSNLTDNSATQPHTLNFFENPLTTLLKTVIMMTGEFDASNLPFLTDIWLSSIVFVLFVFFLHVVLLNLLTALAVSDEQQIRGNAEILSIISQIKLLYEVENIALCLYKLFRHCRCIATVFQNLLVFPEKTIEEACLIVWPNKGAQARIAGEQGKFVKRFDSKIVNEAKHIVAGNSFHFSESIDDLENLPALIQRIEHLENNVKYLLDEKQYVKQGKIAQE